MENSGFLSDGIEKYKKDLRDKNESIFLLCEDLNQYAHYTMWKLKVSKEYLPEILSACSYVRAMSLFQSVIILAGYGLINEAKILLRSLVEAMFLMVSIEKNREYSSKIVEQELLEREKSCKAIRRNIISGIHKLDRPTLKEIEEKIEELKDEIAEKKIKRINKRDLSKAAGLESYYDTIYHLLSGTVHINPGDLEQYLGLTEERNIKDIKWGPIEDELEDILFASIETMVLVMESISNMFEIEFDGKWESIHKTYKKLGEQTIEERTQQDTSPESQGGAAVQS